MLYAKDHKTADLFEPFGFLGAKRLRRMKRSWAGLFREEILAELPVERLRGRYDPVRGRPSKELYATLGAVLLQQMLDLTDEETVDHFAFNLQWHYALDVTGESDRSAYLCPKTLWTMRAVVQREDVAREMFEGVTGKLEKVFEVDTRRQRLDSTHLFSNMRHLSRVSLIARTIRKFLVNLKRHHGERFGALGEELRERYLPKNGGEGVFGMVKPSESERTLRTLAEDLFALIERFGGDEAVARMNSYRLLERVFSEQCRVEEDGQGGGRKVVVRAAAEVASDSLQNPSDPDASYDGHKGKGYQAQVMETYGEPEPGEEEAPRLHLITYVEAQRAHESDSRVVLPALEETGRRERAPERLLADALYGSDDNCRGAEEAGTELIAPVKSNKPPGGLAEFAFDAKNVVTECPQGRAPLRTRLKKERHTARFDAAVCERCPHRDQCPARPGRRGYYLGYTNRELRLERRKAHERTAEFRDRYRFRAGCEATMSELDRKTGIKRLRVRGLAAVSLCVFLKAAGLNILRAARFKSGCRPDGVSKRSTGSLRGLFNVAADGIRQALAPFFRPTCPLEAGIG